MKQIIFFFLWFAPGLLFSQNQSFSGYVSDAESGEKIIGAVVYQKHTGRYSLTNSFGYYTLHAKQTDSIVVAASYIGYSGKEIHINSQNKSNINFELSPSNEIEEVVVLANHPLEKRLETDVVEIPMTQMQLISSIGAESDILKSLQLMPGIQSGIEGSSDLFVRGGTPGENLILLDDVPLYYVNHLGGFISVFNTDALKSVRLTKGGFPARYGGRLSSVLDVRMKEGNLKKLEGNFSMGLLSSKLSIEGPVKKDTSSFILSARGFWWDILLRSFSKLVTNASVGYNFYDVNFKLNHIINEKNRLYFSFYKGDDNIGVSYKDSDLGSKINAQNRTNWGNMLFALRWNKQYNRTLFSNFTIAYTKYRYQNITKYKDGNRQNFDYSFGSEINDFILKSDFNYSPFSGFKIKFGTNSILHNFRPQLSAYKLISSEANIDTSYSYGEFYVPENRLYLENEFFISDFLSGNIGFHASFYNAKEQFYFSPELRALFNIKISENASLKPAYARMQQKVHLLTSDNVSSPMDVWIPSGKAIPPSISDIFSLTWTASINKIHSELSISAYYKASNHLITYKEGTTYRTISTNLHDKLETGGKGKSYGFEFLLQKKHGKFSGWLSYTWSKNFRQFSGINQGVAYPFKYDRRHDFSISLIFQFNERVNISGNWVYGTGYPFSLPIGKYEGINNGTSLLRDTEGIWYNELIYTYTNKNAHRMHAYHRFDLAANFSKQKDKGIRTWTISMYNVYNRQNPYYYYTKEEKGETKLYQQSLFPIIPTISYSFKF
jgi:hypothetical protein